jgi:hypothetical protein
MSFGDLSFAEDICETAKNTLKMRKESKRKIILHKQEEEKGP